MKKVKLISTFLIPVFVTLLLTSCWQHVPPRNVGIMVKTMGNNKGVQPKILPVGRYYVGVYWDLYLYPTNVHIYPFTADSREGSEMNEAMAFQDKDGLPLSVDVAISAHVNPEVVQTTFQTYGGEMENIIKSFVKQDCLNDFIAYSSSRKAENLYSDLKMEMLAFVKAKLIDKYTPSGVVINDIAYMSDIRLPQNVMDAINQKIGATQIALQKEQEVMQAQAEATKTIAKAEGDSKSILMVAEAQAKANRLLSESITPTLVNYMLAKQWNGVSSLYSGTGLFPALFK